MSSRPTRFATPCGHQHVECTDSRPHEQGKRRRYRCLTCGFKFSTIERVVTLVKGKVSTHDRAREELYQAMKKAPEYQIRFVVDLLNKATPDGDNRR